MALNNKPRVFGTLENGKYEVLLLTKENLEGALDIMRKSFLLKESAVKGSEISLPGSEDAREELLQLSSDAFNDGVSIIVKEVSTGKIVSVAFNKIQVSDNPSGEPYFENFIRTRCKSPKSISLIKFMIEMDDEYDIFKNLNVDCLLEIMFLTTLPEYEGRKFGQTICRYSIQLANELRQGIGTEILREGLRDRRPKVVSAIMTSKISQKIGETLEMETLVSVPYTRFKFNGKTFAERIGPEHPTATLVVKKLQ